MFVNGFTLRLIHMRILLKYRKSVFARIFLNGDRETLETLMKYNSYI